MPKGYGYDEAPKKASGFKMKGYTYPGESPVKQGPDAIKHMKKAELSPKDLKASKDTIVSAADHGYWRSMGGPGHEEKQKRYARESVELGNPNIERDNFNMYRSQNRKSRSIAWGTKDKMGGDRDKGINYLQAAGSRSSKRVKKHYEYKDIKPMSKQEVSNVNKDLQKAMYKPLPKK